MSPAVPSRIVPQDHVRRPLERVTAIELIRHAVRIIGIVMFGCHRLQGGRRKRLCQLGQMRTALNATKALGNGFAKAFHEIQPDEFLVCRRDAFAITVIGHVLQPAFCRQHHKLLVKNDRQTHFMDGHTGLAHTRRDRVVTILGVDQQGLDLPKTILTPEPVKGQGATMETLAGLLKGKRHRNEAAHGKL